MNAVKLAALKTLLGDDYEAVAAVLKGAEATEAQATEAGVRFKESKAKEEPKTEPEPGAASPEQGVDQAESPVRVSATEANVAATVKEAPSAGGPPASPPDAASAEGEPDSPDAEAEGEGDVTFIGDMTPDEFMQVLVSGLSQALQPLMDALASQTKAAADAATEAVTKEAKAQSEGLGTLAASLKQVSDRLKELEGDAPKGGFRASESTATITTPPTLKQQSEDDLAKLAGFMIKG